MIANPGTKPIAAQGWIKTRGQLLGWIGVAMLGMMIGASAAFANPVNPTVAAGEASFEAVGTRLDITNTPGTIINWQDFSIAQDEITRFVQQSVDSAVLNRVTGGNMSEILGQLHSNGKVFLINPNGLVIGEGSIIDTAGFIGSSLNISDESFASGNYDFAGDGGPVINRGLVHVTGSGDILLMAPSVENSGVLSTEDGDIVLAAGRSISLSFADLDYISFEVQAPEHEVVNLGRIIAGGGNAAIFGGNILQRGGVELVESPDGRILFEAQHANRISGELSAPGGNIAVLGEDIELVGATLNTSSATGGGEILIGGDFQGGNNVRRAVVTLIDEASTISASALANGDGGRIIVWSDLATSVSGHLAARGGVNGGDGGFIETSSLGQLDIDAVVTIAAPAGTAGQWLLDPEDITIDDSMASSIEGTLNEGGHVTVKTADEGTGEGNITVAAPITKTEGDDASLTLDAHNRIDVDQPISSESNALDVTLKAGNRINVNSAISTNGGSVSQIVTPPDPDNPQSVEELVDTADEESTSDLVETSDEPGQETSEDATEETGEQATDGPVDESGEAEEQYAADTAAEDSEEIVAETTETTTDEVVEESTEEITDPAAAETSEETAAEVDEPPAAEEATEPITEEVAEQTDGESADEPAAQPTEEIAEQSEEEGTVETVEEAADDLSDTIGQASDLQSGALGATDHDLDPGVQVNAVIDTNGGDILIDAGENGTLMVVADLDASNLESGESGGDITLLGENVGIVEEAEVNASGDDGGGTVLIGGEQRGGGETPTSEFLYLGEDASVIADGGTTGDGGTVILYAENTARVYGDISATGGSTEGDGGFVETSGRQGFELLGNPDVSATNGEGGSWLIDPPTFIISSLQAEANIDTSPLPVTFTPSADPAVLAVSTLETALGIGNVILETGFGGAPGDVLVESAVTWTSEYDLTIHGDALIAIEEDIIATHVDSVLTLLGAGGIELGTTSLFEGASLQAGMIDIAGPLSVTGEAGATSAISADILTVDSISMDQSRLLELNPFPGGNPALAADIGALDFNADLTSVYGDADIALGDLTVAQGVTGVEFSPLSVSLTGSGSIDSALQISNTNFNIETGANLEAGVEGSIQLTGSQDFTVRSGASLTLRSDDTTGGASIINSGTGQVALDAGAQLEVSSDQSAPFGSTIFGNFVNNGLVDIQQGSLFLNSGSTLAETGDYSVAAGSQLFLQGSRSNSGNITGGGDLFVYEGILDLSGGFDLTGTIQVIAQTADAELNISDSISVENISIASNPVSGASGTVNLSGAAVAISNQLFLGDGGTLNLQPGVELAGLAELQLFATRGAPAVEYQFQQADLDIGTLIMFGPVSLGGATNYNVDFLSAPIVAGAAPYDMALSGTGTTTLADGGFIGSGNATSSGVQFIIGPDATLVNEGFLQLIGPDDLALNGTLTNTATGSILLGSNVSGGGQFTNLGTLTIEEEKSVDFAPLLSNEGLFEVGNLANITFTDSAPTQTAGEIHLANGTITSLNPIIVAGGSITGNGEFVTDNLTLLAAVLAPGNSPGAIATGGLTLTAGSTLNIELAGSTAENFDQISVSGPATLAGTLNISLLDGYVPDAATAHNIISSSDPVTGQFDAINFDPEFVVTAGAVPAGLEIAIGPLPPDPVVAEVATVIPVDSAPDPVVPDPILPDPIVPDPLFPEESLILVDTLVIDFLESYKEVAGDGNIEASVRTGDEAAAGTVETDEERLRRLAEAAQQCR